jgi:hypothetical protein
MMWVVWRQQRSIVVAFVVVAVVFAIWMLLTGQHEQTLWNQFLAKPCKGGFGPTKSDSHLCEAQQSAVYAGTHINNVVTIIGTIFAPLFGLILGVNAVAREVEQKTNRLAWTQSGSRSRWLASKYFTSIAIIAAVCVPLCFVLSWWVRASHDAARITPKAFPVTGFVEIGYGVLCFTLAVVVGLLIRRAGWSLAVCILLFAGLFFSFADHVRQHLVTPSVTTLQSVQFSQGSSVGFYSTGGAPSTSWSLYQGEAPISAKGAPSYGLIEKSGNALDKCDHERSAKETYCVQHLRIHYVDVYIANGRFWALQFLEGGFYLVLAALLAAFSLFVIRRSEA